MRLYFYGNISEEDANFRLSYFLVLRHESVILNQATHILNQPLGTVEPQPAKGPALRTGHDDFISLEADPLFPPLPRTIATITLGAYTI